jgi:hypothetical protein
MDDLKSIEKKRARILQHMSELRGMRQGTISEQYFKRSGEKSESDNLLGPYWVHTRKVKGKTVSSRLKGATLEQARKEVQNYREFQKLAHEYMELSEQLAELERTDCESPKKKRRRSPSNKTGK